MRAPLLAAALALAAAAPSAAANPKKPAKAALPAFSSKEIQTILDAEATMGRLICFFGVSVPKIGAKPGDEPERACAPEDKEAPDWLKVDAPEMKARDCASGRTNEALAWAASFDRPAFFLEAARKTFPKSKGGSDALPAKIAPRLKALRDDFSAVLGIMQAARFDGDLRGRGGEFLGKYPFLLSKMDEALAAAAAGDGARFKAAILSIAWQADDLKKLLESEPSDPYAQSRPPDCGGLETLELKAPAQTEEELDALEETGRNYVSRGEYDKAVKTFVAAAVVADALGKPERAGAVHAEAAQAWLSLKNLDQATPEMDKALAIARDRNDLVTQRDLLQAFAEGLESSGLGDDLRANYAQEAERLQHRISDALSGFSRGERFFAEGRYEDAKREYLTTAQLGHALSYLRMGDCESKLGNLEAAVAATLEGLRLSRVQHRRVQEAEGLEALWKLYRGAGNPLAASDALEELVRLGLTKDAAAFPDDLHWRLEHGRAQDMQTLERFYDLTDKWDKGEAVFQRLYDMLAVPGTGREDDALRALAYLGRAFVAAGTPEKGVEAFAKAIAAAGSDAVSVQTLDFLDRSLFSAESFWTPAVRDFAAGFPRFQTSARDKRVALALKRIEQARASKRGADVMAAALELAGEREGKAAVELGRALEEGSAQSQAADEAVKDYQEAQTAARAARRPDIEVRCWLGIARLERAQQQWDSAVEALERAVSLALWKDRRPLSEADPRYTALDSAITLKLGDPEIVGRLLRELGYVYLGKAAPLTAMDFINRALKEEPTEFERVSTLAEFARLLELSAYNDQAADYLRRLLSEAWVNDSARLKAVVLQSLASIERKGGGLGQDEALAHYQQAFDLLSPRGLTTKDIPLLLALGSMRAQKAKIPEAVQAYEAAIALSEAFRSALMSESARVAFFEKAPEYVRDYEAAVGGLFEAANRDHSFLSQAYAAGEKARARALLESLRGADLDIDADLRRRETALTQRISVLVQKGLEEGWDVADTVQYGTLQDRVSQLANEMRRTSPRYAQLRYSQPAELAQVRSVLKPGEALVSYKFAGDEESLWAFVVRSDRDAALYRLDASELAALLGRLPPPEPKSASEVWRAVPQTLGRAIWSPVEASLSGATKAILVPDRGLWAVPWAALVSSGTALIDKPYTLQLVPSASILVQLRGAAPAHTAVGVAILTPFPGAGSRDDSVAALPTSAEAVDRLKWLFPDAATFAPPEATLDKALQAAKEYRYLVYYTRCILNETDPWLSAIYFKSAEGKPEALTVSDAMRTLHLEDSDMLVLPQADTERGQVMRGEGQAGLVRGLFYSGARGLLASGWPEDERASRDIVVATFEGIHLGLEPAKALQAAQRDARKRTYGSIPGQHPFYWAGFQLYGDPQ